MKKLIKFFKEKKEYSSFCTWQKFGDKNYFGISFHILPELSIYYDKNAFLDTSDTGNCYTITFYFNWLFFSSNLRIYFNLYKNHKRWK